ncbi:MAG: hypothetical protein QME57_01155, partial [Patescibacteria group bacterium]|nr:hypothetical protein [Patescibacteria group bacterium]
NADLKKVKAEDLGDLKENAFSISFSPRGSYLALLYKGDKFDKKCQVLKSNHPNLLDASKIGICPLGCKIPFLGLLVRWVWGECAPCLNSMIVIKGSVL